MASSMDLGALMQQLAEKRRLDMSLEAYRRELRDNPATAAQAYRNPQAELLRALKGEDPAPPDDVQAPQFTAEPTLTVKGGVYNASREALYRTASMLFYGR